MDIAKVIEEKVKAELDTVLADDNWTKSIEQFVIKYAQALPLSTLLKCLQSLAHLVESEEFGTYRDSHIDMSSGEHMELLLVFKEKCLIPYSGDFEKRKVVRPLIDTVDKAERTFNARKSRK